MKHVLGLALWLGVAHAPLQAVVVIAPTAKSVAATRPAAPVTPPIPAVIADDRATWLTLGLGLAVVLLVVRNARQPRTVAF